MALGAILMVLMTGSDGLMAPYDCEVMSNGFGSHQGS